MPTRRTTLAGMATSVLMPQTLLAAQQTLTPEQTAGPYYPPIADRFRDTDWNLVRIKGQVQRAGGEILHLTGLVRDVGGNPIRDQILEIWQCDANGRYLHHNDTGPHAKRDAAFQGYGAVRTSRDGGFRFRTIVPVSYPGRTPHIHLRLSHPTGGYLVSQLYIMGDTRNRKDGVFRRLSRDQQDVVSMRLSKNSDGSRRTNILLVI